MISSLHAKERVNRSHQICGDDVSSTQIDSACFIRVAKREQHSITITALISFSPQTPLRRPAFEAVLRRTVLFNINHKSLEA
ncbi:MAG: hypothetical protein ACTS5I_03800 [Rhodanobacter sp.]